MSPQSRRRRPPPKLPPAKPAAPPAKPAERRGLRLLAAAGLGLAAIAAIFVIARQAPPVASNAPPPPGRDPSLVVRVESLYNDISLYRQSDGDYLLSFGARRLHYIESIVDPDDELALPVFYTQSMTAGLAYATGLDDAAIIGLGGGRTAWYVHKSIPSLHMTAVELDPEVVRIDSEFLKVKPEPNFDIEVKDGRVYLTRTDKRFDVIFIDAYRGPFVPFHLLTTEFYKLVGERLKPGGVAVQNVEPSTMLFDSAVATIKSAFDHVVFVGGQGNIVIVAYNGPQRDEAELQRIAAERQAQYGFRYPLPDILKRRYEPKWNEATKPLTDDFAPVEYLKAIDRHNEKQP
jgi:spermidine synthase